ncbi:MAG: flippase-like domain-containing protein [Actinomycetota bacterium]|nr:flippase-like domain-containing protein [Actinomycetota bacterium]
MKTKAPIRPANLEVHEDEAVPLRFDPSPRSIIGFGVFVALAILALYFLLPQVAGLQETWHRIEDGSPFWLGFALLFTVGMFGGYVLLFQGVFGRGGTSFTWRESYQITMAGLAATRLFSAGGAGGIALTAWALRRSGMRRRAVADKTISFLVLTYLVYTTALVVFGFGLRFGIFHGDNPFTMTVVPATLALLVTAVGLSIAFVPTDFERRLQSLATGHGRVGRLAQRLATVPATVSAGMRDALAHLRSRDPALLGAIAFWGFQIAVLWASFKAFGESPPMAVIVMAFFVGMLGNLLPLPGGIGGVDGGMIGAFAAFNVDAGLAVVAVLVYRGFTFWLPTVPGIFAYLGLRRTVERWRTQLLAERREAAAGTPAGALHYTN